MLSLTDSQQGFDPAGLIGGLLLDPTVAYLLLVAGLSALIFELAFPGGIVPGVAGVILTLVSLYLFGTLPVDFVGVLLILIAFVMFAAELLAPGFGAFGGAGVVSLLLGSLMLSTSEGSVAVSPLAAAVVVGLFGGFTAFVWRKVSKSGRRQVSTGKEGLVGAIGEARTSLSPRGYVFVDGALWQAEAGPDRVAALATVRVVAVKGRFLVVRAVAGEGQTEPAERSHPAPIESAG